MRATPEALRNGTKSLPFFPLDAVFQTLRRLSAPETRGVLKWRAVPCGQGSHRRRAGRRPPKLNFVHSVPSAQKTRAGKAVFPQKEASSLVRAKDARGGGHRPDSRRSGEDAEKSSNTAFAGAGAPFPRQGADVPARGFPQRGFSVQRTSDGFTGTAHQGRTKRLPRTQHSGGGHPARGSDDFAQGTELGARHPPRHGPPPPRRAAPAQLRGLRSRRPRNTISARGV